MTPKHPQTEADDATPSSRTGTQSIERAVTVLRAIASRGRRGMRIAEVLDTAALSRSTSVRLLQCLQREGLIEQDAHSRKYFLGPLVHELGLLARPRYRLSELCNGALQLVADATQDTVYLSERNGLEAVCTARCVGDYPIKALPLDVGIRRPLGVGAGGLAILGAMEPAEAESVVRINGPRYQAFGGLTEPMMQEAVAQTRRRGYSFLNSVATPGSAALGVVLNAEHPVAAISIAAVSARMPLRRHADLATLLQRQVDSVSVLLKTMHDIVPA